MAFLRKLMRDDGCAEMEKWLFEGGKAKNGSPKRADEIRANLQPFADLERQQDAEPLRLLPRDS